MAPTIAKVMMSVFMIVEFIKKKETRINPVNLNSGKTRMDRPSIFKRPLTPEGP